MVKAQTPQWINIDIDCFVDLYTHSLNVIQGVSFTRREVDILACLLSGRGNKTIASYLDISTRTVDAHLRNLMEKLDCNAREQILDFIEESDQFLVISKHYGNIFRDFTFKESLKEISLIIKGQRTTCLLIYQKEQNHTVDMGDWLRNSLGAAGFKMIKARRKSRITLVEQIKSLKYQHIICLHSGKTLDPHTPSEAEQIPMGQGLGGKKVIFMNVCKVNSLEETSHLTLSPNNPYFGAFEIMKTFLPHQEITDIIGAFKDKHKGFINTGEQTQKTPAVHTAQTEAPLNPPPTIMEPLKAQKFTWPWGYILGLMIVLALVWLMYGKDNPKIPSVASDLRIPTEDSLLLRPQVLDQMKAKLIKQPYIQTIALIGMGGGGKTTLARHFGRSMNYPVIWEVNAESKDSLINSFKGLAHGICHSKEDREALHGVENIQDLNLKEEQLLLFVKKRLQMVPNWLLIYDNLEPIGDLKYYLPQNPGVWGNGKLIITSKDSNLAHTNFLSPNHVIELGELTPKEALGLFTKILKPGGTHTQPAKELEFLKHIPAFPLDISLSAYYIKGTGISYDQYLKEINQYKEPVDTSQTKLLKDISTYDKTRYGIISLSFKKLMDMDPGFKELLYFICLLDSQNIPVSLLKAYRPCTIVDSFLYALRKYSLVTGVGPDSIFSVHRSTQSLGKTFLSGSLNLETQNKMVMEMVKAIKSDFEDLMANNPSELPLLIPHIKKVIHNLDLIPMPKPLQQKYKQELWYTLGHVHMGWTRNLMLAREYFTYAYQIDSQYHNFSLDKRARFLWELGEVCIDSNHLEEGIAYCQESLALCQKLPHGQLWAVDNLQTIAHAYTWKNDFKKAKEYFEAALQKMPKHIHSDYKTLLEIVIYWRLSELYSLYYPYRPESKKARDYILKALTILSTPNVLHDIPKDKKYSCWTTRCKTKLGEVYCRQGMYKDAMAEGFKGAQYIIDNHLDTCSHKLLKTQLWRGMGEVYLRTGKLKEAEAILSKSIEEAAQKVGEQDTLTARVFRMEARIRLGNLREAEEDLRAVERLYKGNQTNQPNQPTQTSWPNYTALLHKVSLYHGAILQYKQHNLQKSMEYLKAFVEGMDNFCKGFLPDKEYQALKHRGAFRPLPCGAKYTQESIHHNLKTCADILKDIYGDNHPFVKDYVIPNATERRGWWYLGI